MRRGNCAGALQYVPELTWILFLRILDEQEEREKQEAAQWKERLKELKKAKPKDEQAIEEAEAKVKALTRESKFLANKAKEIENAVYDLKAVNPNKKPAIDTRTPEELLGIIENKGKEVAEALAFFRKNMDG
jgi:type I restriction enzyme M protein